jgi:hypothetical protein
MSPRPRPLARRIGLDRNPLRRRIDRVQAALALLLIAAFLTAAPVLTAVAGHWARTVGMGQEHAERAWREVTAIVVRGPATGRHETFSAWGPVRARARWTAPDGRERSGLVPVTAGTRTGSSFLLWVNASGTPTGPPMRPVEQGQQAALAELVTLCVLAVAACLIADTGRILLDRRRLATWEKEWRAIGPLWTRQP